MYREIYLDNAATTKPYPEVVEAVARMLLEDWGNPSSAHRKGRDAKAVLEQSRETVASALGAAPSEIYFTSGGTEANNLAITGACLARNRVGGSIVTSTLEHPSVTKTVRGLRRSGRQVEYIDMRGGRFDFEHLSGALTPETSLVTIMRVHNELGYLYPTEEIVRLRDSAAPTVPIHCDAVQSFGKLDFTPAALGVQLASVSAHKIGGPKGVGALYVQTGTKMFTTAFGGGQERGLRSGTEPLPLIAGFAKAVELTMAQRRQTLAHVTMVRNHLVRELHDRFPLVRMNSLPTGSPFIVNFTLPGVDNAQALQLLSDHNIFISTAAACTSNHSNVPAGTWRKKRPLVLELAGVPFEQRRHTFRIGLGRFNTTEEVNAMLALLTEVPRTDHGLPG
jgi:cysteine desulfurase